MSPVTISPDTRLKPCPGCRQTLPPVCYWRDRSRPDRLCRLCKNCQSIKSAGYWKTVYYPRRRAALIAANSERRRKKAGADPKENEN
jgi:RNase P subunit RPR2